jgi:hypothetical protein
MRRFVDHWIFGLMRSGVLECRSPGVVQDPENARLFFHHSTTPPLHHPIPD